jgi:hypothetical protein
LTKPLVVVGASMGQYGGVWAHDEARKSFGIAGADVVDAPAFSLPVDALGDKSPCDSDDVVASLNDVLTKLAAEAGYTRPIGTPERAVSEGRPEMSAEPTFGRYAEIPLDQMTPLDDVRLLATPEPTRQDFPRHPPAWRNSPTKGQCAQPRSTQPQRTMVCPHAPRWRRHLARPPHPASPDPRMVAQDGRHRGHHLGEPNHELDLAAAATCDVTFGSDALALRRIARRGHEYVMPIQSVARRSAVAAGAAS